MGNPLYEHLEEDKEMQKELEAEEIKKADLEEELLCASEAAENWQVRAEAAEMLLMEIRKDLNSLTNQHIGGVFKDTYSICSAIEKHCSDNGIQL